MKSRASASLIPVLLLPLAACAASDAGGDGRRVEVTDSAGVQIVLNRGGGHHSGALPITEELRLGAVDGGPEELLFSKVRDVLIDEDGRMFVGNGGTATVRLFDADGTFLREFGGRGGGPSEIPGELNDMMWGGDQITLIDWRRGGKTLLFDTTGAFHTSWRNTSLQGRPVFPTGHTPSGWVGMDSERVRQRDPVPGKAYPVPVVMRRLSPESQAFGDTLFELPPRVLYGSPEGHGLDWPLFMPVEGAGFDRAGNFYHSPGSEYRINVWDPEGRPMRSIRREHEPVPITNEDVEDLKQRSSSPPTEFPMPEDQWQEQLQRYHARIDFQAQLPGPETRPPLGALLVAHDGSFWVERQDHRQPAEWWERYMSGSFDGPPEVETSWDVFSRDGRFLGNVLLPPRFQPMAVAPGYVVGVMRDDLDVEYVVRYGVGPSDEGERS